MAASLTRTFGCPVELALEILGGKWKPVILAILKTQPQRYSELRARLPRLSDKMLTQRLRDLEDLGLVSRRRSGAQSSYALTTRGKSLKPALEGLYDWGCKVAPEVGARFVDQS